MNQQTTALLEQLAQKLNVTVEMLWGALVKQAHTEAIIVFMQIIFLTIVLLVILISAIKLSTHKDEYDDYTIDRGGDHIFLWIVYGTINIICFFIMFTLLRSALTCINNPEYWALKELLNTL